VTMAFFDMKNAISWWLYFKCHYRLPFRFKCWYQELNFH